MRQDGPRTSLPSATHQRGIDQPKPNRHYFAGGVVVAEGVFFGGVVVFGVATAAVGLTVAGTVADLAAGIGVFKAALLTTGAGIAFPVRCCGAETVAGCPETLCTLVCGVAPLT